ncbi:hypothetical protein BsWGS_28421 [Bradybaena similaris]
MQLEQSSLRFSGDNNVQDQEIEADSQNCREGWHYHEGSCYSFSTAWLSWGDGQAICKTYNATLAEIGTSGENEFLRNMARTNQGEVTYLGGTDMFTEGTWEWASSGTHIYPFTDWGAGEPDGGTAEDCLAFAGSRGYHWADVMCNHVNTFICEAKPTKGPTVG